MASDHYFYKQGKVKHRTGLLSNGFILSDKL